MIRVLLLVALAGCASRALDDPSTTTTPSMTPRPGEDFPIDFARAPVDLAKPAPVDFGLSCQGPSDCPTHACCLSTDGTMFCAPDAASCQATGLLVCETAADCFDFGGCCDSLPVKHCCTF